MLEKEYNIVTMQYQENGYVYTDCLDIEFINLGSSVVYVKNFPLDKGKSIKFTANMSNVDEVIKEPIFISFALEVAQRNLWVIKKVRVNKN